MANDLENLIKFSERFAETLIKFETGYGENIYDNFLLTSFKTGVANYTMYTEFIEDEDEDEVPNLIIADKKYEILYEGDDIREFIGTLEVDDAVDDAVVIFDEKYAMEWIDYFHETVEDMNKYCINTIIHYSEERPGVEIRFWYITKNKHRIHEYYLVTEKYDSLFGETKNLYIYKLGGEEQDMREYSLTRESLFEILSSNGVCGWPYLS